MDKLLIKGAKVIDPANGLDDILDLLIIDGRIAKLAPNLKVEDAEIIQAVGLVCAPGLVDMHVHLRDPGQTQKEDIESGCCAAAAGGVTSIACMPNTTPVCDKPEIIKDILTRSKSAPARLYPVAAVTKSLGGTELTNFQELKKSFAVAVSDD
ncbi:MAG TPA: dihydroorotase, partial [Ruminococcaceae bacterium]|nr:dihydroorotase [Oscillospiraceae bacterium]